MTCDEKNYKFAFVILHYNLQKITEECVNSINSRLHNTDFMIYIVDNASTNDSGKALSEKYSGNSRVDVIINKKNYGFSKGNNIGYAKARKHGADFVIVINNDTEIVQSNFLENIVRVYGKHQCYVIGPDIITPTGQHQSPESQSFMLGGNLVKWYLKRKLLLWAFNFSYRILGKDDTRLLEAYYEYNNRRINQIQYSQEHINCQVQGACIIFCPPFIAARELAFEEISFMYGEEAMLGVLCSYNSWKVVYAPTLKILHKEKSTSKAVYKEKMIHEIEYTKKLSDALHEVIKKEQEFKRRDD